MKVTKIIARENINADSVKEDRRAIPEEELKEYARLTKLVENEETAELVSDEEYEAYEAAESRAMTDEEIERFQKRYLDFISPEDLGCRKDVAVMDYVRCVAARAIDQCQHPERYDELWGIVWDSEGKATRIIDDVDQSSSWAGCELESLLCIIELCGLVDDIDCEEYGVLRNTTRDLHYNMWRHPQWQE